MLTTAAPLLLVAISATATTVPSASFFSRKKLESFTEALLWLDHNDDGRVTLVEASAGLRALWHPAARTRRSAQEPAVVSPLPIDDDLCVPSTEPVAFVDCVSSRARRAAALGENPRTVLWLQTELDNLYGGLDDNAPVGAAERTCDELVDSHSANCRELLRAGFCRLSCGHHAQQYFRNKGSSAMSASRRRAQMEAPEFNNVDGYARILLSSDWHLEPWYDTTGAGTVDGDVRTSRFNFADATLGTFGTCRAGISPSAVVEPGCTTTSLHDPPLAFGRSHFEAFAAAFPDSVRTYHQNASRVETSDVGRADADVARGVIFMLGDGQAHGFHQPYFSLPNAQAVSNHARTLLKMTKEYFAADRVFWTPGNNDGPHSAIFMHRNRDSLEEEQQAHAESVAWADALIAEGIVTDALPRRYDFVLEPAPDCVDDAEGHLQNANTSCAAVIRAIADMRVSNGYDACGCSIEEGEGMSSSGCAVGKTTNPFETIDCACHRPIDDPEQHARMNEGVSVPADTALGHVAWQQPQSCLAPGEGREGCVQLIEVCPASCNDCFVPRVEVHEMGLSPSAFFRRTGYYLKQLDPNNAMGLRGGNLYVIVLNTNLGAANAQQTAALLNDLAWVQHKRGGVYLLGHHPHVMANPALVPEGRLPPPARLTLLCILCAGAMTDRAMVRVVDGNRVLWDCSGAVRGSCARRCVYG